MRSLWRRHRDMAYHVGLPRAKRNCPRNKYGSHAWTPWYPVPDDGRVLARFCTVCISEDRKLKTRLRGVVRFIPNRRK